MRRVLMIAPHFPPDSSAGAHRVRLLAPYLGRHGWEPTVLTVAPEAYESVLDPDLADLVPPQLRIVRVPAWPVGWTRPIGIGDLGIRAFSALRRAALSLAASKSFDVVFVTVYPTYPALLGPLLKRRLGIRFVLDYQDPWVGSWGLTVGGAADGGPDLKSRVTRCLALRLEPLAVRAADAITAVSTATYEDVLTRVPLERRPCTATLPIGWDAADIAALDPEPNRWFDPLDGAVHLSYVGTLLPHGIGVLRALLAAVARLRDMAPSGRRFRLHFFGTSNQFGDQPSRVQPVADSLGVGDLVSEHPGRIPYLDALKVLVQSSGILLLGSSERHYTASKIYPALLARRPVLALFHGESSVTTTLRAFGRSPSVRLVTFRDGEEPDIAHVLEQLQALVSDPTYSPGAVDASAIDGDSAPALAERLAGLFDHVCNAC